eukprot:125323-Pleurochrysis_carterae.AAC.2
MLVGRNTMRVRYPVSNVAPQGSTIRRPCLQRAPSSGSSRAETTHKCSIQDSGQRCKCMRLQTPFGRNERNKDEGGAADKTSSVCEMMPF